MVTSRGEIETNEREPKQLVAQAIMYHYLILL